MERSALSPRRLATHGHNGGWPETRRRPPRLTLARMGKHKKRARNGGPPQPHPAAAMAATKPAEGGASDDDDDDEWGGFEVAEVATAIRVVEKLGRRPDLFASKLFKPLRAALDPLVQLQLKKYDPVDYAALQQKKGHGALLGLQGMRANGQVAKQGTVQRWVRDCDSIPNEGGLRVRLLQAVLQAGRPIEEQPPEVTGSDGTQPTTPGEASPAAAAASGEAAVPEAGRRAA
eukprot:2118947-Prymnesium_polylepis.1